MESITRVCGAFFQDWHQILFTDFHWGRRSGAAVSTVQSRHGLLLSLVCFGLWQFYSLKRCRWGELGMLSWLWECLWVWMSVCVSALTPRLPGSAPAPFQPRVQGKRQQKMDGRSSNGSARNEQAEQHTNKPPRARGAPGTFSAPHMSQLLHIHLIFISVT